MASINTEINLNQVKKNGECTVYVVVHIKGERKRFNTGVSVIPKNFNRRSISIKGNSNDIRDKNLVISNCIARINKILVKYRLENRDIDIKTLGREYETPSISIDFIGFMRKSIDLRKDELTYGSLKHQRSVLKKLTDYQPEIKFSDLTIDFLKGWEKYLKIVKKNSINTIHSNLKCLNTYVNLAVTREIISKNPFENYRLKKEKNFPEYLTEQELSELWKLYKKNSLRENYQRVLRMFLFCCFTGLRISDFRKADHTWIIGKNLVFTPFKTKNVNNKIIKIPLTKKAVSLINDEGTVVGGLFYKYSEQRMRKFIKDVAKHAGIEKEISWHTSRHTFATLFYEKTRDILSLQKLLGHGNINQTMVYAHISEDMVVNQMNNFTDSLKL